MNEPLHMIRPPYLVPLHKNKEILDIASSLAKRGNVMAQAKVPSPTGRRQGWGAGISKDQDLSRYIL